MSLDKDRTSLRISSRQKLRLSSSVSEGPVRYFSLDQVAQWRTPFCKKWFKSPTGGKIPPDIVSQLVFPPLNCPTMKAGEWLLTADREALKKAGMPESHLKIALVSLNRFRLKCATVNAQSLLSCRLRRKEFVDAPNKPAPKAISEEERMWKMRDLVAHDVMKTEETYNKQLKILDEVLFTPLLNESSKKNPILTEEEVRIVFSDIKVIHTISTSFLESLKICFANWDNKKSLLGAVFQKMVDFFRVYADYVRNYDKAVGFLATLSRTSKLSAFFKANVTDNAELDCNLTLSDLLIAPVQRIPRYPLLLKDVIKYTPPTHPDYKNLNDALEGIQKLADWVNENIRNGQSQRVLVRLQKELVGLEEPLLIASRLFIKQGEVVELSETEKPRRRVFLLFNDILIIADPKYDGPFYANTVAPTVADAGDGVVNVLGGDFGTIHGTKKIKARFQWFRTYRLLEIRVEDEPPFSAEFATCFAVRVLKKNKKLIYAAENVEVRDSWKKNLEEQITKQVDLESKKDEIRDKAALPKAELVKAMFGAQYTSLTKNRASRRGTRDSTTFWRKLSVEEKESVAKEAMEYVKMVRDNSGNHEDQGAKFGTFSMTQMKVLRETDAPERAESLRVRSTAARASILSESDASIAFGPPSETNSMCDDFSESSFSRKKEKKRRDKKKEGDDKKKDDEKIEGEDKKKDDDKLQEGKTEEKEKGKEKRHHHHHEK